MIETFQTQIETNKRHSLILMLSLAAFGVGLCALIVGTLSGGDLNLILPITMLACLLTLIAMPVAYNFAPDIVLSIAGAKRIAKIDDPELFNVTEEMAIAAGTPLPDIYLIDDKALNAFATGKAPETSAIAITKGLRSKLTRDELQAVIGHEMGHIINYDIRLTMVAAVIGGAIALISDIFLRTRPNRERIHSGTSNGDGPGVALAAFAILFAIFAPIISKLLQLSISREREYLADATSVRLTRNPTALISALRKLAINSAHLEHENRALEHLYIVNPSYSLPVANIDSVWHTHPPLDERIRRILQLAGRFDGVGEQLKEEKVKDT